METRLLAWGFHYTQAREWVSPSVAFVVKIWSDDTVRVSIYNWPHGLEKRIKITFSEAVDFFDKEYPS